MTKRSYAEHISTFLPETSSERQPATPTTTTSRSRDRADVLEINSSGASHVSVHVTLHPCNPVASARLAVLAPKQGHARDDDEAAGEEIRYKHTGKTSLPLLWVACDVLVSAASPALPHA